MRTVGTSAMILAAGKGERMRPLTLTRPKPLIEVAGKPLIEHALAAAQAGGAHNIVINVHYLADQLENWARPKGISVSEERGELLDTGGGIAKALPYLGPEPFFVLNGDGFWIENAKPALQRLRLNWRDDDMDCLLLLCTLSNARGFDGKGDFTMQTDGILHRYRAGSANPFAYIGGYLVHPRLFVGCPQGAFSMNVLWDKAIHKGRLFGLEHRGLWLHVGTPAAVGIAERELSQRDQQT
jgi:N-acetyl-alpha-D-muramate 1-phosphate uridylyltransferase